MKKLLEKGQFTKFSNNYFTFSEEERRDLKLDSLCDEAVYNYNICGYGLACYLNLQQEAADWHELITIMMEIHMPYLPGACQVSFAHVMRQLELNPHQRGTYNAILMIDFTPEGNLPDGEIYEFAQEILKKWPDHETAQRIINNRKNNPPQISTAEKITQAIALDKKAAFRDLVLRGRYIETRQILPTLSIEEIEDILFMISFKERNVCAYDYCWFLMREQGETPRTHTLMARMAREIFDYEYGGDFCKDLHAKELAFFHVSRAAELNPENIDLQENILRMYTPGHPCFDDIDVKALSEKLIAKKTYTMQAIRVLELLDKK
ncbi:hypothetical protein FJ366_00955 [Candidatus Dependentiae bacterium]|nr:hypothetical protein [Candidatus Dependentiae bacterium]